MYVGAACLESASKADENGLTMRPFVNGIRKIGLWMPPVEGDGEKVSAEVDAEFKKQRAHLIKVERIVLNTLRFDIDIPYTHRTLRDLMSENKFYHYARQELPIEQHACGLV